MGDTSPEWNSRQKAQKARNIWVFAPLVLFRGHLDRVVSS
jgi:hypothetical protein